MASRSNPTSLKQFSLHTFFSLFINSLGKGLLLFSHIVIARLYGASAFGSFVIALGIMRGINVLISSGYTNLFIKYNIAFHTNKTFRNYVIKMFRRWLIVLGVLGLVVLQLFKPVFKDFKLLSVLPISVEALFVLGFLLAVLMLLRSYLIGNKQVILGLSVKEIIFNVLFITFLWIGTSLFDSNHSIYYAYGFSLAGSIIVGLGFKRKRTFDHLTVLFNDQEKVKIRQFILFLYINGIFQYIYSWIDTLLVGTMISPLEAGYYRAAYQIAQVIYLLKMALNQVIGPHITELELQRNRGGMLQYYQFAVLGMFYLIIPMLWILIPFGDKVLALFGPTFTVVYLPLIILLGGQLVNIIIGPAGVFLILLGSERLALINIIITAILNVILNVILIPRFGIVGAAIASSVSLTSVMLLRAVEVKKLYGVQPLSKGLVYLLIGGAGFTFLFWQLRQGEYWGWLTVAGIVSILIYIKVGLSMWKKVWQTK